jgi:peroxiredoxin Q/BCP
MPLEAHSPAPDFSLPDQLGTTHKLSDYRGKPVLLYFYPKDNTSGCTTEACNFRDDYSAYQEAGVVVIGVSPDSPKSHTSFVLKFDLPFTLLADEEHQVCELYGVWGKKSMYGKEYYGVLRTTFLISPEGTIQKVWEKVKPAEHSQEVLAFLAAQ